MASAPSVENRNRRTGLIAAAGVAALVAAVLGYASSTIAVAGSLQPGYTAMAPHTAVPMLLLGFAVVFVGVVFGWVYDPTFGLLSLAAQALGFGPVSILSSENLVTFAVVIAALWPQVAFCMVLFLAGLNNLSEDQIGAGRVDGAKGWPMLRHVVLPQLSQVGFIALAVSVIGALRSFDMVAVMTSGGPYGSSTVLAYQMYEQAIFSYRFGYGAAIATVLFAVMLVFIVWYVRGILRADERGA
mgnify:CR=1 FL=1